MKTEDLENRLKNKVVFPQRDKRGRLLPWSKKEN